MGTYEYEYEYGTNKYKYGTYESEYGTYEYEYGTYEYEYCTLFLLYASQRLHRNSKLKMSVGSNLEIYFVKMTKPILLVL